MSYILDALRRLEQDKEKARKPANPIQTVLDGGPQEQAGQRRGKKTLWPWLLAGLLLLFLAVGITFWVARTTAPEPQAVSSSMSSSPGAAAAVTPAPSRGAPAEPGKSSRTGLRTPQPYGRETARKTPAVTVPRVSPPSVSPPPGAVSSVRAPEPSSPLPPPDTPVAVPSLPEPAKPVLPLEQVRSRKPEPVATPVPAPAAREQKPPPTRLSGSAAGLRISAIVWSPNREKRFAIVNLKTVYEGDSVGGSRVMEILEDDVIFEKAGSRFSVGMGGR